MGGNAKLYLALLVGLVMVVKNAEAQMSKYEACEVLCGSDPDDGGYGGYGGGGYGGYGGYDESPFLVGRGLSAINLRPTRPPPPPRPPSQPSTKTDYIRYGRK